MKIYFVRHAQTEHNRDGLASGHNDTLLTEQGKKQAEETSMQLDTDIAMIYCSDLTRCKQTAEILNRKLNLPIVYDPRLRERKLGELEGQEWIKIDEKILAIDKALKYNYRDTGGESVEDVKNRLLSFVEDVRKDKKGDKILAVTHGGVINLLHHLFNKDVPEIIHNASVHEFEFPE